MIAAPTGQRPAVTTLPLYLCTWQRLLFLTIMHVTPQVMCKMGAIIAAGILDGGGRNATVGLRSRSGYFRRTSVVGLAVFTQYW